MDKKDPDFNDVEHGAMDVDKDMRPYKNEFLEAAAWLTIWSLLVINEGAIRFTSTTPSNDINAETRPPNVIRFISSLGEVFFGLLGLAVGVAAFIWRKHSPSMTKLVMVIQTVLGYFVFAVYVFTIPAYVAHDTEMSPIMDLSLSTFKFLVVLGILTSFHFCLALQGGQFIFMARLVAAATGQNFLMQNSGNKMRAIFWNLNMALSGLWTLITGAILLSAELGENPYAFPPNVGTLPAFTLCTGIVVLIWGFVGVAMAVLKKAPTFYLIGTILTFLLAFFNYGIGQLATFVPPDGPLAGPVAMHNGLVFVVIWLGPYFVMKNEESLHAH